MKGRFIVELDGDLFDRKDGAFLIALVQQIRQRQNSAHRKEERKKLAHAASPPANGGTVTVEPIQVVLNDLQPENLTKEVPQPQEAAK